MAQDGHRYDKDDQKGTCLSEIHLRTYLISAQKYKNGACGIDVWMRKYEEVKGIYSACRKELCQSLSGTELLVEHMEVERLNLVLVGKG